MANPAYEASLSQPPSGWDPASQLAGGLQTTTGPLEEARLQGRGLRTHQVLQSTLILAPGGYTSLLCTQGHCSSTTQPPCPSSSSPSGHTQPLMHSVWYWGQWDSGVQGLHGRPSLTCTHLVAFPTRIL